jgi:hypothetical protein
MDKEFSTPFDDKGRCHHHPQTQMASKKFNGGWNILLEACPRCIEVKYEEDNQSVGSGRSRNTKGSKSRTTSRSKSRGRKEQTDDDVDDNTSVSSKKSVQTRTAPIDAAGKYDKNGCCPSHPTLQVAKKKLLGGWKTFRDCPKCDDPTYDDMADNRSMKSTGSTKSKKSMSGGRSVKSNSSRKGGGKSDRFGALPFDGEGYCHAHPSIRLAKKKTLGGWKVLHDICPDCANDASSQHGGSVRSKSSKRSGTGGKKGTGRVFDDSGSDASGSRTSGKSSGSRKKKIRVKDMRYVDENDKEGRYSGDVNEDHQPHGSGKMKYKDGSTFEGVWAEGSMAHGKSKTKTKSSLTSKTSSSSTKEGKSSTGSEGKSSDDWARKDIPQVKSSSDNTTGVGGIKTVRKMKWMDYYGDPGQYTGQVDSTNMPNGKGTMRYDHGLVQDGMWSRGQFMEGSDLHCAIEGASTVTEEVSNTRESKIVTASSSRSKTTGVGERSTKKSSSSGRGQDP